MSPIELLWTAKNINILFIVSTIGFNLQVSMKNHYICCQNYLPSAPPVKKGKQLFVNIERRCDDGWTVPCHLNSFMGITRIFGDNYDGNDVCDPV